MRRGKDGLTSSGRIETSLLAQESLVLHYNSALVSPSFNESHIIQNLKPRRGVISKPSIIPGRRQ